MSGIYGRCNFNKAAEVDKGLIERMGKAFCYGNLGTEDSWVNTNFGLGVKELVGDLTPKKGVGTNESRSIWAVCTGNIYNYDEISKYLISIGYRFETGCLAEMVVYAYEEYGKECVKRFQGEFALAVWDKEEQSLLLARDRLGLKPLFYTLRPTGITFASVNRAILQDPEVGREVNLTALYSYFFNGYPIGPQTMFRDIFQVLPGHILVMDKYGKISMSNYWDLPCVEETAKNERDYTEKLLELLKASIKRRLAGNGNGDVGVLLSGGLDSSALLVLLREVSDGPIKTFSVDFKEESYSEISYARKMAEYCHTEHYEVIASPERSEEIVDKLVLYNDNLGILPAGLGAYPLVELASKHAKVVFVGAGADELWAGYPTFKADMIARYYQYLPWILKEKIIPFLVDMLPVSSKKLSFEFKARRFIKTAGQNPVDAHLNWKAIFTEKEARNLYSNPEINRGLSLSDLYYPFYKEAGGLSILNRYIYADLKFTVPHLPYGTTGLPVDGRQPFYDQELVEFALTVPPRYKLRGMKEKYLLKRAMSKRLPSQILRRKKGGLTSPISPWLCKELKPMVKDKLSPVRLKQTGFLNSDYISGLLENHFQKREDNSFKIWLLLCLMQWHKTFMAGSLPMD